MKKTKIIATIGPASKDTNILSDMILNGMDIIRLNMTHANYEFCEDIISKIKEINKRLHSNISIMMDIKGPNITVNKFENGSAILKTGDKIRIYNEKIIGDSTKFSVSYSKFIEEVKVNNTIKLNDGLLELLVLDKSFNYLLCEVIVGGKISDDQGVNVIGQKLNIPFLSEKDKKDIEFACKHDIDYLALSFLSSADEVLQINDLLIEKKNDHLAIISKIENERALEDIDAIIEVSDGIMVSRGDLGVELPLERIPGIQKTIINKCHNYGKVSIVATEMMRTMENELRPSRAEVSDVANAVIDGTDAVLLSGETTIGKYPVETVSMMSKIIETSEENINYYELMDNAMRTSKQDTTGSIAYSVVECANRLKCKAIATPTMSGYTAKKISRFRPICPIIALSPNIETVKSLNIYYGVHPVLIDDISSFDKMIKQSVTTIKNCIETKDGDKAIITGGYPFKEVKHTNFMKVEEL